MSGTEAVMCARPSVGRDLSPGTVGRPRSAGARGGAGGALQHAEAFSGDLRRRVTLLQLKRIHPAARDWLSGIFCCVEHTVITCDHRVFFRCDGKLGTDEVPRWSLLV